MFFIFFHTLYFVCVFLGRKHPLYNVYDNYLSVSECRHSFLLKMALKFMLFHLKLKYTLVPIFVIYYNGTFFTIIFKIH